MSENEDINNNEEEKIKRLVEVISQDNTELFLQIATLYDIHPTKHSPWQTVTKYPTYDIYRFPPKVYELLTPLPPRAETLTTKTPIFEIMGLPESGKSMLCKYLQTIYPLAVINDEFAELSQNTSSIDIDLQNFILANEKICSLIPALKSQIEEKRDNISGDNQIDKPIIITRGPNDILAFSSFVYLSRIHPNLELDEVMSYFVRKAVKQLSDVDAVVLFDNSLEVAQLRRFRKGERRNGKVVNNSVWTIIDSGYSWWLQYVYPILREKYGTGLLVIDGREDLKKNNLRVYKYIQKVLKSIPSRNV